MGKHTRLLGAILCSLFLFVGCAFVPQTVKISPSVSVLRRDIGKGQPVALAVVDERPRKIIGRRGGASGPAAEISTNQDIAEIIHAKVAEALTNYNFMPVPQTASTPVSMKVEIRWISYSTAVGFWTGTVHTEATLKVVCKNLTNSLEKLYRTENAKEVVVVPVAEENERLINEVVSQVLGDLLNDRELLRFLGGEV